ncbi:MAG: TonB-dependent receptor [Novosphingobium sp.]|uniref:TonB-dependent receptor n=1 Tax=Novosphingobium sp. TaxID=1874826 RepID=UPI00261A62ED|nr:TonB-dependent receptor [Novosphingobium sp.]MCP5385414.1 TonB-dependent receptor [Novosphingobium sp.]
MKTVIALRCGAALLALGLAQAALAEDADTLSDPNTIVVTAPRPSAVPTATQTTRTSLDEPVSAPDAAAFIARQPGMALIDNGAISGQVQYHGLFGERILLRVDGQHFTGGGPNAMDPPMHYAPLVLLDRVEIARGVSPVRDGPGLGGGIDARLKAVHFGTGAGLAPQLDLTALYRSGDDGRAIGGVAGLASANLRLGVIGSWEQGGDTRFPGGRIAGTSYRRAVFGAQFGWRQGSSELSLEYRRQQTGASGNPPFAMDIVYFHADFLKARFSGELAEGVRLESRFDYAGIGHRMNNFSLRPAPAAAMTRQSDTTARTLAAGIALRLGSAERHLRLGADFEQQDKQFRIYNPLMTAFSIFALDHGSSFRTGGYAEARGALGGIEIEAGARIDRHEASAGAPRLGSAVPAGPAGLAATFAAAQRDWQGTTFDAALRLWGHAGNLTPRLALARKTRVPSLIERFSWLPTEASGGLADGNIYVGDPGLKPEIAWQAEAGIDWQEGGAYARPSLFYRRIENYIQGVPYDATPGVVNTPVEMVAAASGDSTPLRFANVGAELYGADIAFGLRLAGPLRLDGVATWLRGRRTDIADNLYRIAPTSGRLALAWDAGDWSLAFELEGATAQKRVSLSNSEQPGEGHVVAGIFGHWQMRHGLRIDWGIENLFDRRYADFLSGYNRNAGGDVPLGSRLPGMGRSAFVRMRLAMP